MTVGEEKSVEYLSSEFKKLGLEPLQSSNLHGISRSRRSPFGLNVPLVQVDTEVEGDIRFGKSVLKRGVDISIQSDSGDSAYLETTKWTDVPVVFAGFGIESDNWNWHDYRGGSVKGKIVLVWANDPGFYAGERLFRGKRMTYYGRWTYKLEEARRQGAVGAFVIHETAAAGYGWDVAGGEKNHLVVDAPQVGGVDPLFIHGWITAEAAKPVLADSGVDAEKLRAERLAQSSKTQAKGSIELKASAFSIAFKNRIKKGLSTNLCGVLKGNSKKKASERRSILLSAHWDHLGKKVDSNGNVLVYPGAIDNATGVAALLELARVYRGEAQRKAQPKDLIFCSFTAEEQGLLGAEYFVATESRLLKQLDAVFNFDSMTVGEAQKEILFLGRGESGLEVQFEQIARELGRVVVDDLQPEKGYFFRSDHLPFARLKIPSICHLDIGHSSKDYLLHHYHKPTDVYDRNWLLGALVEDLEFFKALIDRMMAPSMIRR